MKSFIFALFFVSFIAAADQNQPIRSGGITITEISHEGSATVKIVPLASQKELSAPDKEAHKKEMQRLSQSFGELVEKELKAADDLR